MTLLIIFWLYVSKYLLSAKKTAQDSAKTSAQLHMNSYTCTNLFSLVFKNDHYIYLYMNLCYYLVHKTLCHFLSGYLVRVSLRSLSLYSTFLSSSFGVWESKF
ncbi:hypothetical protein V8G54_035332 [Vigna mungo]|uniref:Secreted protein n=1 Tax=Vigna mungo TaxID=3915 RepID=A0AAQ3REA7_VIGMU